MSESRDHEIYIWPVKYLLEMCKKMEDYTYIDCVTLQQTLKDGYRGVVQITILGILGNAYLKKVGNEEHIVFKGLAGLRPRLPGTTYRRSNPKVAMFVVGTREILEEAGKGIKVAVYAYVALDVLEEILQDHWSLARLGVTVASHVAQATLSTGVGVAAGVILVAAGAPVVLTFVVVATVTLAAGFALSYLDRRFELTKKAVEMMMEYEDQRREEIGRIVQGIRRDVDLAVSAVEAAREGLARAREARDRIERLLRGIPDLQDFNPFGLR